MTVKQIRQMKQQAAEEMKSDNYTIKEVVKERPAPAEIYNGQTSDQEVTVVLNNVWKDISKQTLKELVRVSGISKKNTYEIKIKGYEENKYIGMRYHPEWVSIKERLPKEEKIVLVCTKTKAGVRSINRAYYMNETWHGSGSMAGVTHWMLMPDLPENT